MNTARDRASRPGARGALAASLAAAVVAAGLVAAQSWVSIGPTGGRITALAASPLAPLRVFGGAESGGLYRSLDGGASWAATGASQLGAATVSAVTIDQADADVVYAGTDSKGVFKSTDGGATWLARNSGLPAANDRLPSIAALAVDPADSALVLAGASDRNAGGPLIYRSTNGGDGWTTIVAPELAGVPISRIAFGGAAAFAATDGKGVWASDDGGVTWQHVGDDALDNTSVRSVTVDAGTEPETLWAVIADGAYSFEFPAASASSPEPAAAGAAAGLRPWGLGTWALRHRVYYAAWAETSAWQGDLPAPTPAPGEVSTSSAAVRPSIIYVGSAVSGVQASTDHGDTWLPLNRGLAPVAVDRLAAVDGLPGALFAGTDGSGVWRLRGGESSWSRTSEGLNAASVTSVAVDPRAPATLYAGTQGGGVLKSLDGGASWGPTGFRAMIDDAFDPWIEAVAVDPNRPGTVYALIGRRLFRSENHGGSWAGYDLPTGLYASSLVVSANASATVLWAAGSAGLARSDDHGVTWVKPDPTFTQNVQSLAGAPSSPQTLYAGTYASGVWKSTNEGTSWSPVNNDGGTGFLTHGRVPAIAIDPRSADIVFAAVDGRALWKSSNGGVSWENLTAGLLDQATFTAATLSAVAIHPGNPNTMFASATTSAFSSAVAFLGVYRSDDAGAHWVKFGSGLPAVQADLVLFDPTSSNRLYAAVRGHGLYRYGTAPPAPPARMRSRVRPAV